MRVLVVTMLLLLPLAAAQNPGAPHLSTTDFTLYAHHRDGDDETVGWMNADINDPDSTDVAMGASATAVTDRTWTLRLDPGTAGDVVLDGTATVNAHIGGGSAQGVFTVSADLRVDGTSIGSGAGKRITLEPADAEYPLVTWEIPVAATIPAGASVEWVLTGSGAATAVFLGVSEGRGKSHVVLPVASADVPALESGTDPIFENLTGDAVDLSLIFNATSAQYVYNWTAPNASLRVVLSGNLTGNVTVAIVEGNMTSVDASSEEGVILVKQSASGDVSEEATLEGPGNWTIRIEAGNLTGSLRLVIEPMDSMEHDEMDGDHMGDDDGEANETAAPNARNSPGIGLAVVLAMLVAVGRRRP